MKLSKNDSVSLERQQCRCLIMSTIIQNINISYNKRQETKVIWEGGERYGSWCSAVSLCLVSCRQSTYEYEGCERKESVHNAYDEEPGVTSGWKICRDQYDASSHQKSQLRLLRKAFSKFRETRNFDDIILNFAKFRDNRINDFRYIFAKLYIIFAKVMKYFLKRER